MDNDEKIMVEAYSKLPAFKGRISKALKVIELGLEKGNSYVAISWGKDSVVLLHLVQSIRADIKAIYHAHIERDLISNYSEVIDRYTAKFPTNLTIQETWDASGNIAKNLGVYHDYPVCFLGLRAEESVNRKRSMRNYGLIHQYSSGFLSGTYRVCPLGWWSWIDIWAYIFTHDLPYLDAYRYVPINSVNSRTTCHISKTTNKMTQKTRLEDMKKNNFSYYNYLKDNYPEMF